MSSNGVEQDAAPAQTSKRSNSFSNQSETSQTAAEYVNSYENETGAVANFSDLSAAKSSWKLMRAKLSHSYVCAPLRSEDCR